MKIVAHLLPVGSHIHSAVTHSLEVSCGSGDQILRWLAAAACHRMAYDNDALMGSFVPQVGFLGLPVWAT
jgi:hypothetical protein